MARFHIFNLATDELVAHADTRQEVANKTKAGYYVMDTQNEGPWPYVVYYPVTLGLMGCPCNTLEEAREIYYRKTQ